MLYRLDVAAVSDYKHNCGFDILPRSSRQNSVGNCLLDNVTFIHIMY